MYNEKKLIMNPATSENMCAASARIANDPEIYPPTASQAMNTKQIQETKNNFFMALLLAACFFKNLAWFCSAH